MLILNLRGAAAHGDYLFGWENDSLQKAMDNGCNLNQNCSSAGLVAQDPAKFNACTNQQQAVETVDGCELFMLIVPSIWLLSPRTIS